MVPSLVEFWGAQMERMGRWAEEVTGAGCQGQGRGCGILDGRGGEGGTGILGPGNGCCLEVGGMGAWQDHRAQD